MSDNELSRLSAIDVFNAHSETLEDAQKKKASENGPRMTDVFRMDKEGKYKIRILPLAPIKGEDGNYTLPRKGYEYPIKELLLKIVVGKTKEGKDKINYVLAPHLKYIFPQLKTDLIDLFVSVACEKYADDKVLCELIKSNSFSGGLRYDSKRYMYILNLDKRDEGVKMFALSYSQYSKELEARKLDLWKELREEDENTMCPISSVQDAYPVEITRSKEDGKTDYKFNINVRKKAPLTENELQTLLELPRLPEVIYRYSRRQLEATIEFLNQYEEKRDIDVLSDPRLQDFIEQVNMLIPADDQSHFKPKDDSEEGSGDEPKNTIDDLWATFDHLAENGLKDTSEEGQNLRNAIVTFIDEHDLDVTYSRRASNEDLLNLIQEALDNRSTKQNDKEEDPEPEQEPEDDDNEPVDQPSEPVRNDDTNEPAARMARRANKPTRRRQ